MPQMSQKTHLTSVLYSITSGFTFRSKVENDKNGDLLVIQLKDLKHSYSVIGSQLTRVSSSLTGRNVLLEKGDVLFIGKGANNYSIEFNLDLPNVVASSAFFILRPDQATVIPAYLAWYMNQTSVQRYLKENTAGTYIPNINKGTLDNLMIEVPPLSVQKKIVAIDQLRKREQILSEAITNKRSIVVDAALQQILKKTT